MGNRKKGASRDEEISTVLDPYQLSRFRQRHTSTGICSRARLFCFQVASSQRFHNIEPKFFNVSGAHESKQGIYSASLYSLAGRYGNPICRTSLPGIESFESTPRLHKRLQIWASYWQRGGQCEYRKFPKLSESGCRKEPNTTVMAGGQGKDDIKLWGRG